ncbi:hypothetical protein ACHAW6_000545 [Cyclotella cf. meneghiniana]
MMPHWCNDQSSIEDKGAKPNKGFCGNLPRAVHLRCPISIESGRLCGSTERQTYHLMNYYGTIFIDHFSRFYYVHFMTVQTSAKTLQARQSYKKMQASEFHYRYDDFFETISLNKPDTMIPSKWQILAVWERPNQLPPVEQLLQVCNSAPVPQGNINEKQPADDFSIIPEEFSLIDFGNGEVVMIQNLLTSQWKSP